MELNTETEFKDRKYLNEELKENSLCKWGICRDSERGSRIAGRTRPRNRRKKTAMFVFLTKSIEIGLRF